jgi:hypothetical protein
MSNDKEVVGDNEVFDSKLNAKMKQCSADANGK